jgi:hypothetical protein
MTLEWLTFIAAALAAVGTIAGPVIAYQTATKTIAANQAAAGIAQRQARVDRYIGQAIGPNPVAASFAVAQLDYLLSTGELTLEQTIAAQNAVGVSVETLQAKIEGSELDPVEENEARAPGVEDQEGSA